MTRPLAVAAVLLVAPAAAAQDMLLSQILIDGEGWVRLDGPWNHAHPVRPNTRSVDGSTAFDWRPGETFLHARQLPDRVRAPYAPLRVPPGGEPKVTELATYRNGRGYAATPVGVQVYDPTGRLCGLVAPPVLGAAVEMFCFDGERVNAVANGTRYARKLRTRGAT